MMRKIYIAAWILTAISLLFSVVTGSFDGLMMVLYSLIALGLFYALALRSVFVNTAGAAELNCQGRP